MGLVIDTSALVEQDRLGLSAAEVIAADEAVVLPAHVWAEALIATRHADTPARAARWRAKLERLRLAVSIEPFGPEIAEHYADISRELAEAGTPIPLSDLAVAATARWLDFGVLVGAAGEAHFWKVHALRVVRLRRAG